MPGPNDAFLFDGQWAMSQSAHLKAARYDYAALTLHVRFKSKSGADSGGGSYHPVTYAQAEDFAAGGYRNTWIWNHLRVRGSATAHRIAYTPA